MGSTGFYPDEAPVTKAQFRECVEVTGYVSVAERPLDPGDDPGADPADLVPGALVFTGTPGPVDLRAWQRWWSWTAGRAVVRAGRLRSDEGRRC